VPCRWEYGVRGTRGQQSFKRDESIVANLKWKTPRSKTRSRRAANWKLQPVTTVQCPQCKQPKRPHFACESCGTYNGRHVVDVGDEHAGA